MSRRGEGSDGVRLSGLGSRPTRPYAVRQETPNITPLIHRPVSIATDRPNAIPAPTTPADSRSIVPSRSRAHAPSADRILLDRSWVSLEEAVRR